jgi:hypothetical protein
VLLLVEHQLEVNLVHGELDALTNITYFFPSYFPVGKFMIDSELSQSSVKLSIRCCELFIRQGLNDI